MFLNIECDVCDLPGRICDPDTGACVCPPLTTGATCEICQPRAWGFMYLKGCKVMQENIFSYSYF